MIVLEFNAHALDVLASHSYVNIISDIDQSELTFIKILFIFLDKSKVCIALHVESHRNLSLEG
jgi:hypothetical protein